MHDGLEEHREGKVAGSQSLQQESQAEEFSSRRSSLESNPADWIERSKIRQMVTELGRSSQDCKDSTRQFISGGIYGEKFTTSSSQWKISKEVLPKCVARSVKHAYGRYLIIAFSTYGRWSVDIVLRTKVVQVIFWHAS